MIGNIYILSEDRGSAKVIELVGKNHVKVQWADGVVRKLSRGRYSLLPIE